MKTQQRKITIPTDLCSSCTLEITKYKGIVRRVKYYCTETDPGVQPGPCCAKDCHFYQGVINDPRTSNCGPLSDFIDEPEPVKPVQNWDTRYVYPIGWGKAWLRDTPQKKGKRAKPIRPRLIMGRYKNS